MARKGATKPAEAVVLGPDEPPCITVANGAKVCPKCPCELTTMGAFAIAGLACECRCHDASKRLYGAR